MKKRPEELELPIRMERGHNIFWCKPLPCGSKFSFFFLMIIMEVHSPDSWRELFLFKEKIYYGVGEERRKKLLVDDAQIWEYLTFVRLAAEKNKTSEEMIVLLSKYIIMDNIISVRAGHAVKICPKRVKRVRTEPTEPEPIMIEEEKEVEIIIISSDEDGEMIRRSKKESSLSIEIDRLFNTKLRGDCKFKGLASGIRLTLEAALIIMEVHNMKKWRGIYKAGDLIYEKENIILTDDERITTYLRALKELSKQKNISKKEMVLELKYIHSGNFHSDYVWEVLAKQPERYKTKMGQEK